MSTIQLATGLGTPNGITLDAQYVYWTDIDNNTVMRVAKSGGTPAVVASGQYKPLHVVVDDTYAYWTNSVGAAVMKAPKVGGGVPSLVAAAGQPTEIAQDDQTTYFIVTGGSNPGVAAVAKAGGTATIIMPVHDVFPPRALLLDANYVYASANRGVSRVPKGGGTVDSFGTSTAFTGPRSIAVDDLYVYSDGYAGPITPFDGTYRNLKSMAPRPRDQVTPLVDVPILSDGDYLYENLKKVSKCGGPVFIVRPGRGTDIALDSDRIYWTAPGFVGAAVK